MHTGPPWSWKRDNFVHSTILARMQEGLRVVWKSGGLDIAYVLPSDDDNGNANAEFIVRAVNLHDDLVEVADMALTQIKAQRIRDGQTDPYLLENPSIEEQSLEEVLQLARSTSKETPRPEPLE